MGDRRQVPAERREETRGEVVEQVQVPVDPGRQVW